MIGCRGKNDSFGNINRFICKRFFDSDFLCDQLLRIRSSYYNRFRKSRGFIPKCELRAEGDSLMGVMRVEDRENESTIQHQPAIHNATFADSQSPQPRPGRRRSRS
jgi:hypothetical protein